MGDNVNRDWKDSDDVFYNWSKSEIIDILNQSNLFGIINNYSQGTTDEDINYCLDSWVDGSNGRIGMQNRVQFVENQIPGIPYNPTFRYGRMSGSETEIRKYIKYYNMRNDLPYPRYLTWILYSKTTKTIVELKIVDIVSFIEKRNHKYNDDSKYRLTDEYITKDVAGGQQELLVVKDEDIVYSYH